MSSVSSSPGIFSVISKWEGIFSEGSEYDPSLVNDRIAIANNDVISVYNLYTGERVRWITMPSTIGDQGVYLHRIFLSPNGTQVLTILEFEANILDPDYTTLVWDVETGEKIDRFPEELSTPKKVVFSPTSEEVAVCIRVGEGGARPRNDSSGISVRNYRTGTTLFSQKREDFQVERFCYSPDGTKILVSSVLANVDILDAKSGERLFQTTLTEKIKRLFWYSQEEIGVIDKNAIHRLNSKNGDKTVMEYEEQVRSVNSISICLPTLQFSEFRDSYGGYGLDVCMTRVHLKSAPEGDFLEVEEKNTLGCLAGRDLNMYTLSSPDCEKFAVWDHGKVTIYIHVKEQFLREIRQLVTAWKIADAFLESTNNEVYTTLKMALSVLVVRNQLVASRLGWFEREDYPSSE